MSCVQTLREKGLRLTPQRRLISDVIHSAQAHLTAEEIIAFVQSRMPGVNKSTIYRTLELLEQGGCVYRSALDDRFIYHPAEDGQHHHLVCRRCGKTVDCDEDLFGTVEESLGRRYGFHASFKHVVIGGLCGECGHRAS